MGLPQVRSPAMTAEEFIEWENAQPDKHEFLGGKVLSPYGSRFTRRGFLAVASFAVLVVGNE